MSVLLAKNIGFGYSDKMLFSSLNLEVKKGECLAIMGESGCGKSTLCNVLAGIIPRNIDGKLSGEVLIDGENIQNLPLEKIITKIGIVFQNPDSQLFAPTVEDELAFGPENLCLPVEEIAKRIDLALHTVGMAEYRFSNPSKLSGGQKQLIALAATLTLDPDILLFDEVMSQLDTESIVRIKNCIVNLKKNGKTIIMVEHNAENTTICDRTLRLENGTLTEIKNG